ncbi:hypothetical protein LVB77_14500 [Lysobacter sp. 5GHs7-4]|uniref:hypothetical protein n=1 Tax=Lysobacter sp. 5GHs7-4 TaxID=2904253 RepID=UPI001E43BF2A|nr:hypothetical protein [Lysobacter sp. 5GHs7-4]UHQ21876.1 hypothetical protein LVB77_14500 [Lysobacter sp. 5GHs7-4]
MTDRIAACLGDIEVGTVFERLQEGYFSQVGRHRDMQTLQTQGFHEFEPACRWVARWVELREPMIRAEVQARLDRRRGFGQGN